MFRIQFYVPSIFWWKLSSRWIGKTTARVSSFSIQTEMRREIQYVGYRLLLGFRREFQEIEVETRLMSFAFHLFEIICGVGRVLTKLRWVTVVIGEILYLFWGILYNNFFYEKKMYGENLYDAQLWKKFAEMWTAFVEIPIIVERKIQVCGRVGERNKRFGNR
jgi:hypothetical protein